jgi:hypothetical protein
MSESKRTPDCEATSNEVQHGITCQKVPHANEGYMHADGDDTPYEVDGVRYCGRCHFAMPTEQKGER